MIPRFAGRLLLSTVFAAGWVGLAQAQQASAPIDGAGRIEGVPVACAGVGESSQTNPRWEGYAVKLTFARKDGAFLGNEMVHVRDVNGHALDVHCHAPWVLMGLPPGHYNATAEIPGGEAKHISFTVPRQGRRSIVLHYALEAPAEQPVSNAAYRGNGQSGSYQSGTYQNGQYYGGSGQSGPYQNRPYQNSGYRNEGGTMNGQYPNNGGYENGRYNENVPAPAPNATYPQQNNMQPANPGMQQNPGYDQGPQ